MAHTFASKCRGGIRIKAFQLILSKGERRRRERRKREGGGGEGEGGEGGGEVILESIIGQ